MYCEGQGEGERNTEGAALRFSTSAHVHTPAVPAEGGGLLKCLKLQFHVVYSVSELKISIFS